MTPRKTTTPAKKAAPAKKAPAKKPAAPKKTAADFGFVQAFLKAHPDVKKQVDTAIAQGWTQQRLEAAVKTTTWWRGRTEAQRKYDVLSTENPAEATRQVEARKASILTLAGQMGVTLSDADAAALAKSALVNGRADSEVQAQLAGRITLAADGQAQTGQAAVTVDALRSGAAKYGVTLSDDTLLNYTRAVAAGRADVQQFEDTMREQAKVLYPTVADRLDQGYTVRDLVDPYLQIASKELGIPDSQMDLTDTKWTTALRGQAGATMSADEWLTTLRTDTRFGWDRSPTARQQAFDLGTSIRQMFQGA